MGKDSGYILSIYLSLSMRCLLLLRAHIATAAVIRETLDKHMLILKIHFKLYLIEEAEPG